MNALLLKHHRKLLLNVTVWDQVHVGLGRGSGDSVIGCGLASLLRREGKERGFLLNFELAFQKPTTTSQHLGLQHTIVGI